LAASNLAVGSGNVSTNRVLPAVSELIGGTTRGELVAGSSSSVVMMAGPLGGSLSGVDLDVAAGDITGVMAIATGGTGTSSAPTYGKVLLGNSSGTYDLVAT
jgi:hypothetical protein